MRHLFFGLQARTTLKLKKWLLLFSFLLPFPVLAQTLYLYPATAVVPRGSYRNVTAVVSGVSDKAVSWTTDAGALVDTNSRGLNEPCTIGLYAVSAGTYPLTATSDSGSPLAATSTTKITASSTPTIGHPRLPVTVAKLPFLQAKDGLGQHRPPSLAHEGNVGSHLKSCCLRCRRSEMFCRERHNDSNYRITQITLRQRGNRGDRDAEENLENHTV